MGTGSTFPSISRDQIANFLIPVCSIKEQRQVVQEIESRFSSIEKIEQAILAKAFRGELVEADPDDEPAEELLKRISAEKEKLDSKISKRKKNSGSNI